MRRNASRRGHQLMTEKYHSVTASQIYIYIKTEMVIRHKFRSVHSVALASHFAFRHQSTICDRKKETQRGNQQQQKGEEKVMIRNDGISMSFSLLAEC